MLYIISIRKCDYVIIANFISLLHFRSYNILVHRLFPVRGPGGGKRENLFRGSRLPACASCPPSWQSTPDHSRSRVFFSSSRCRRKLLQRLKRLDEKKERDGGASLLALFIYPSTLPGWVIEIKGIPHQLFKMRYRPVFPSLVEGFGRVSSSAASPIW